MTERALESLPRLMARIAGSLYLLAVITAVAGESLLHGRLSLAAGLVAVAFFLIITVLLYNICKPVNRRIAFLAAASGFVGLTFEALRWNPGGIDFGVVFHGFWCVLIGYLVLRSTFLPRALGALMTVAGLAWLTNLSLVLARDLSPYNVAAGFLGEGALMLWLLVMGVNADRWTERAIEFNQRRKSP